MLYYGGGTETVTKQGTKIGFPVYLKGASGNYVQIQYDLYRAGSSVTFYKRGDLYGGVIYKDGGEETVTLQGEQYQYALHASGTKRANLKLATFDATTTVLACAK